MREVLIVTLILLTASAWAQERPLLRYECDPEVVRAALAQRLPAGDAELLAGIDPADRAAEGSRLALWAADQLFALHMTTGEPEAAARGAVILRALAAPWVAATDEQLRAQITERGAQDTSNLLMREVAWDLARLSRLADDAGAAHRCAVILQRLAEVMPSWPLVTRAGELRDQDDPAYRRAWDANGLWGVWFVSDLEAGLPVARAFDLIHDTGAMQALGALEQIERDLVRYVPEHYLERPLDLGNLTHYALRALPQYGMAIPEPDYVHIAVQRYRWILNAMYYADGFWHEGSPAYHKDITYGLRVTVPAVLRGYSDPPGYVGAIDLPRYDDLDLAAEYARRLDRTWDALKKLTFPDKDYAKLHDATYPHGAWWDVKPERSRPRLLGGMGHAILGTGAGEDMAELHLHYSGTHGHEHLDALNIILFARGRELISETRYRDTPGWPTTREWHTATAGHNTVVIDERNQESRFPDVSHRRPITPEDAMTGISQHAGVTVDIPNWQYRDGGHGNALNDPKLRCFATDWDTVQVAEAEAERAYFPDPEVYRRTVALVRIDDRQVYALDIFRVRGGAMHDWMLHGCLQDPYEVTIALDLAPIEGTLHKYLGELRAAQTDQGWVADFAYESGAQMRTHLLGQPGAQVILGRGPAMRRDGYADFIDLRHEGGESVFVAVHDPYEGTPNVLAVAPVAWGAGMDVGLRVTLANGMTDVILSAGGDAPFEERATASGIVFAGRLAHLRFEGDRPVHAYGVDATRLRVGDIDRAGPGAYEGEITVVHRVEAGAAFDAFETDAALPAGLEGRCLVVDLGGTLTQAFTIDRVEPTATGALIYTRDEPGMEIRGDLIKLMYYPGWAIPRPARFHVADTLRWAAGG